MAKKFPDVDKDGKVTKKDVLMAKGVIPKEKGMKAGGRMKKPTYKKGGTVSSASKRADGIAIKGKTKGRII